MCCFYGPSGASGYDPGTVSKIAAVLIFVAFVAGACGGDDKPAATPVGSPVVISATNQVPALSTPPPGATSVPSSGATTTPARTPTSSPPGVAAGPDAALTQSAQQASVAATAAAGATPTSVQATALAAAVTALKGADCSKPGGGLPAPTTPCVGFVQTSLGAQFLRGPRVPYFVPPQDLTKGLALFKADLPGGDKDLYVLFGRDAGLAWKPFGAFTNALKIPVKLPADVIVCPRNSGAKADVLSQAGGSRKDSVNSGDRLKVEEFVLATAGSVTLTGEGTGFFRISTPMTGWVDSRDVLVSDYTRCITP